jgi:hypothetical protein
LNWQKLSNITALYAEMRLPEALHLVEVLLGVGLEANAVAGLHETVVALAEVMALDDKPDEYVEHSGAVARVLLVIAGNN